MIRMWHVAWREFTSVVLTKGFLIGMLLTPVLIAIGGLGAVLASKVGAPKIDGRIAIVDQSGVVSKYVLQRFTPEAQKAAQDRAAAKLGEAIEQKLGGSLPKEATDAAKARIGLQAEGRSALAEIEVEIVPDGADIEAIKSQARDAKISAERDSHEAKPMLAVVVIPKGSVVPASDGKYSNFELFFSPRLDYELQRRFEGAVAEAILDARLTTDDRVVSSRLTPEALRAMLATPDGKAVTLTSGGQRESVGGLQMMIPAAFMLLLMMAVMTAGQYLMTALIEEKSSRVMEVLLSAVSPMQLMVGKILGQMAVALLILIAYGGLGMSGLIVFALMDLIEPIKLVWFGCYFLIAFFSIASIMAAIGASVNEMREAQTLMTPVMMLIMFPWLLWLLIQRAPNSPLVTIASFFPGVSPFAMVMRLGGAEPIPFWQIPATIAVGIATSVFFAWAAAKIFRVGVLMYGKPPNFATLMKWVRMA